ncbi:uncharacterized protein MEPE_00455 [Melanopsichium pennsylvanicum]|uniref:Uncharacterized protein n=2 Tax=Melanopsichium pennsylvanicum TaxID=63383 RepID=A0AAJ5C2N4_9BASI|nr:hypothetical protein BN887_04354 [Melanopsichium pennsylvanicum 4]SNX81750.1 uncharacterized protein MEPE_00455 [Melanopsichium pennsylvanicum]
MPTAASRSSDGPPLQDAPHLNSPNSTVASHSTSPNSAPQASAASSSSQLARQSPKSTPRPLNQHHHPYRIELLDVTPVSVSLLWSTRPPPLSAIPLDIVNSQLRKRVKARSFAANPNRSSSPQHTSARASAVSPSPTSATAAAVSKSRSQATSHPSNFNVAPLETPISKLTDGLVATRSLNRKVTKIRLRPPPTVAALPRRSSHSSAPSDSAHNSANDDDTWPSDDGATAVDDEAGSASDASDSGYEGVPDARHHVTSVFKDRVSVTVNGQDWSHVLLGERGSHEAIVVIFGLEPESDYDVQFLVKAGLDGTHDAFRASLRTRSERDSARSTDSSPAVRSASPSPLSRLPVSAPELDAVNPAPQRLSVLQAELEASEALKASLIAEIKKARKESSKQEAGLRHEIDAVKRGMDRLSATDHRSRQKVLALQELIKQTTIQTKEIHEQADVTEKQQPEWEEQDAKLEAEVEVLRKEVEAEEAAAQAHWDKDEAALAVLDKELRSLEATAKALESERDELKNDKLALLRAEIEKIREQAKEALNRPAGGARRGGTAAGSQRGGHRHVSGPHLAAHASVNKAKPHQGGRGGKAANFGNRSVSGPPGQFSAPANNTTNSGFAGASRGFMQSFGKGFRRGQNHNHQSQSLDAMASTGYAGPGGPSQGAMLPSGSGYVPAGMQDQAMGMGGFSANGPYGPLDLFYAQPHQDASQFPSGASEVSQDDLYDPTLGFDPYDPSIDARRRSSLPLPQLSFNPPQPNMPTSSTTTALNPANPEFVPSTGSNHASPIMCKMPSTSGGKMPSTTAAITSAALPAHTAIATPSPPPGVASVEHSPTSSSRFAFPLARHLPTKSSSSALASANTASANPNNVLNLSSDLNNVFASIGRADVAGTASPFARHSPLQPPQGLDASAVGVASSSCMSFAGASPRFGAMSLHGGGSHSMAGNSEDVSSAFGGSNTNATTTTSTMFGPLDYDPGMDQFGLLSTGPNVNSGASGLAPFSGNSTTMGSIFGAGDNTWSAPTSSASSTGMGSGWITSSPPLGSSNSGGMGGSNVGGAGGSSSGAGVTTGGDIWCAPTLPGLRSKLSRSDLNSSSSSSSSPIGTSGNVNNANVNANFGGFNGGGGNNCGGGRIGVGAIGHSAVVGGGGGGTMTSRMPSRSSPLTSPISASSPRISMVDDNAITQLVPVRSSPISGTCQSQNMDSGGYD